MVWRLPLCSRCKYVVDRWGVNAERTVGTRGWQHKQCPQAPHTLLTELRRRPQLSGSPEP